MKQYWVLFFIAGVIASGCKKEKEDIIPAPTTKYGEVSFKMKYTVDAAPLYFDSLMYKNAAGNKYSVTKIHYYLSHFMLYTKGELKYSSKDIFYLDAQSSLFSEVSLKNIPVMEYDSVSFTIGLDTDQNISNSLPASNENIVMIWPDMMGGGYHFLKLEGHWNSASGVEGYAMHIGRNGYCINTGIKHIISPQEYKPLNLSMTMNVNEWFANPNMYDLANDGVYSMGNAVMMKKLSENGTNVFSIQ